MITINADGLRRSIEIIKSKRERVDEAAVKQYRSHILGMYWQLLKVAPQFSSDFVSNFDIEVGPGIGKRAAKAGGSPHRGYQRSAEKEEFVAGKKGETEAPHEAGDEGGGFQAAYMRGVSRMRYITYYGQPVYFTNSTPLEIDTPLIIGPDGVQKLRDGVVIGAWASISSYLQARYGMPRS